MRPFRLGQGLEEPRVRRISGRGTFRRCRDVRRGPEYAPKRTSTSQSEFVGMRWTRHVVRRMTVQADGEVVWFWRSDAGAKVVKTLPASHGRRWQPSYGHREEHEGNR